MNNELNKPFTKILGGIGWTTGLVYAFSVKSGFWKGLLYVTLGSMAGSGIGAGVDLLKK